MIIKLQKKWIVVCLALLFIGASSLLELYMSMIHLVLMFILCYPLILFLLSLSVSSLMFCAYCLQCRDFSGLDERSANRAPPVLRAGAWFSGDNRTWVFPIRAQQPPLLFRHWRHTESYLACVLGELGRNTSASIILDQFQAYPTLQEDRVPDPTWDGPKSEESKVQCVDT